MSLNIERMRYLVRLGLGGLSEDDMDDVDVDELLNISLWDLEDRFPFRAKQASVQTLTVINQFEYDVTELSQLDAIESVAIITEEDSRHKLYRMTRDWLDENFLKESKGEPERYLREKCKITLYPIPDKVFGLELQIREAVSNISSSSQSSGLPRNWDEIVVQGAIWRRHFYNEDYNLAQQAANFQIGLIRAAVPTESKEEKDARYGGLDVLHEFPPEREG